MQEEQRRVETEIVSHQESINQDIKLEKDKTFAAAGINSYLVKCYQRLGYIDPTPIQFYSISTYLERRPYSMIAQSKSGTGKTLSYLSIVLTHLLSLPEIPQKCSYLIILPTRQLTVQVYQTLKMILNILNLVKAQTQEDKQIKQKLCKVKAMMCIGGIPFEDDKKNYNNNGGTVLVGTIGRLLEFVDRKIIKPNDLQMLVLDEGDKLFENKNSKFSQFIDKTLSIKIQGLLRVRLLLYSATFTTKLCRLLKSKRDSVFIQTLASQKQGLMLKITTDYTQLSGLDSIVDDKNENTESVISLDNIKKYKLILNNQTQSYFNAKIAALKELLMELKYQRCLVFVEKKVLLEQINERLIQASFEPLLIHGSLSQASRIKLMNQINHSKIIIASDLLARGIDISLDLVILFDARKNDTFWHRIGRTGRYGHQGVAISLDNLEDWSLYDKDKVQLDLDVIEGTISKNKEWYGTYMTQLGNWKETNPQKEISQEKEYRYFDQNKIAKGKKKVKMDPNFLNENENHCHGEGNPIDRLSQIQSQQNLKQLVRQISQCEKCTKFITSIERLTGYNFQFKKLF